MIKLEMHVLSDDIGYHIRSLEDGVVTEIDKIKGLVVGQGGEALQFTVVDSDGNAVDISSFNSTLTAYLRDQYGLITKNYTLTFVGAGTDGQVKFTPTAGDIDRAGVWLLQFKLTKTGVVRYVGPAEVYVSPALG